MRLITQALMTLFKHYKDLQLYLTNQLVKPVSVGFVPTMGALHAGHLSLIEQSKKRSGITVSSIFINPAQFNNRQDFLKYPSTLEADISALEENGCDILFLPDEKEIYPDEASKNKHFDIGYLETVLEGKFRPGHFQGVCLIVDKLLNIVNPDLLFIGQKDFQQCMVIKRLIRLQNKAIKVIVCPTLREKNGLAMSSRNLRLQPIEREIASELFKTLQSIKQKIPFTDFIQLQKKAIGHLNEKGFKVEYLQLAKAADLEIVNNYKSGEAYVILIAAVLNEVRLIDNILL